MRFDPERCPKCGEDDWEVLHETHPGAPRTDATLRCRDCGHTTRGAVEWPKDVPLKCIVSDGAESRTEELLWPADERVRVDDEGYIGEHRVLVTSIEHRDGRRVRTAPVDAVAAVWAVAFDDIEVKVSVNLGPRTEAYTLKLDPDDDVHVGDVFTVDAMTFRVDHVKTPRGVVHRGTIQARDIVRLYGKPLDDAHQRETSDDVRRGPPRGERSRPGQRGFGGRRRQ